VGVEVMKMSDEWDSDYGGDDDHDSDYDGDDDKDD